MIDVTRNDAQSCVCRASSSLSLAIPQPVPVDRGSSVVKNRAIRRITAERRR